MLTVRATNAIATPPLPLAVMVYIVVTTGETSREPFTATAPMPWSISALVALVELQARVAFSPCVIVPGLAPIVTVGAGVTTGVGVGMEVGAGVTVGVTVGVGDAVGFGVGSGVGFGVAVRVGDGTTVGVAVGIGLGVGPTVGPGVKFGVGVGVSKEVGLGEGIVLGVGLGVVISSTTAFASTKKLNALPLCFTLKVRTVVVSPGYKIPSAPKASESDSGAGNVMDSICPNVVSSFTAKQRVW
ncbi:MAG: hypothetical protein HS132_10170 [Planctomycetia bacterium]|nr:hypothetical protein [Planctomycetia bacterium]